MFQECSLSPGWFQLSMFPDQATTTVVQYNVTCNVIFGTPNLHRHMASIRPWNVQGSICIVSYTISNRYYFIIVVLIIKSEIVYDMDFVINFHRRKQFCKTCHIPNCHHLLCHQIRFPPYHFAIQSFPGNDDCWPRSRL